MSKQPAPSPMEESIKRSDLSKLKEMYEVIAKFQQGIASASAAAAFSSPENTNLHDTLMKVGNLAGGATLRITFNDKHDEGSYRIRNQYGYIQRNKKNSINEDGIYFEKLYQLAQILKRGCVIDPTIEPQLRQDLILLQQKIAFILKEESALVEGYDASWGDGNQAAKLSSIISFASANYEQIAFTRIKSELIKLKNPDWASRDGRYSIARVFTIIGELSHELFEGKKPSDKVEEAFKGLDHIRSKLIHAHKKVAIGALDDKEFKTTVTFISKIAEGLDDIIQEQADGRFALNKSSGHIEELYVNIIKLEDFFKGKKDEIASAAVQPEPSQQSKIPPAQDKIHGQLKACIIKAHKAIEREGSGLIDKKQPPISVFLSDVNKSYQEFLLLLGGPDCILYPTQIADTNQQEISDLAARFLSASKPKQPQPEPIKVDDAPTIVAKIVKKINKELSYLKVVESNVALPQEKRDYVTHHAVTVIGEYIRDIEEKHKSLLLKTPSVILDEARSSARNVLNEGGAHNTLDMDLVKFADRVKNDILPADEHFQALFTIYESKNKKVELSFLILKTLGQSFLKLGLYNEAIDYFNQAKHHAHNNSKQIQKEKMLSMGITPSDNMVLLDYDEILFGIDSYKLEISTHLANALILYGNYEAAQRELESTIFTIDMVAVLASGNNELLKGIAITLNMFSCCLYYAGNYKDALEAARQSIASFAADSNEVQINLAACLTKLGQHDEANQALQSVLKYKDCVGRFDALEHYVILLASRAETEGVSDESKHYIDEIESIARNNAGALKVLLGEKYQLVPLRIIGLKLQDINNEMGLKLKTIFPNTIDFTKQKAEVLELEGQVKSIVGKLTPTISNDEVVHKIHRVLIDSFTSLFVGENDSAQEMHNRTKTLAYFTNEEKYAKSYDEAGFIKLARNLASARSNYAMGRVKDRGNDTDKLFAIELLKDARQIQEEYGGIAPTTLVHLGIVHCELGDKKFDLGNQMQNSREAQKNFSEALSEYNQAITYIDAIKLDPHNLSTLNEASRVLGMSYARVGYLTHDLSLMQKAINYYTQAIKIEPNQNDIINNKEQCEVDIFNTKDFFTSFKDSLVQTSQGGNPDGWIKAQASIPPMQLFALNSFFNTKLPGIVQIIMIDGHHLICIQNKNVERCASLIEDELSASALVSTQVFAEEKDDEDAIEDDSSSYTAAAHSSVPPSGVAIELLDSGSD